MSLIKTKVSLLPFNTFHIDAEASYFATIRSAEDLRQLMSTETFQSLPRLFLGGGSNVLFTNDFQGLVIHNQVKGIRIVQEDETHVTIEAGSGEDWHGLVMYCVDHDFGGLENLSLIPGTTGAAPMQNIGAYGVEVKDTITSVTAIDLSTGEEKVFSREECRFGYRESYFKHAGKGMYFISSVTLTLTRKNHQFNVSYGAIRETLKIMNVDNFSVRAISDAVIHIRKSKLPDPAVTGNAGSFFKNPTITLEKYSRLRNTFPSVPGYQEKNNMMKVPAGWLIEQCGWKGKRLSNIGVHPLQALVLVNYGGGEGKEIWKLAMDIRRSVEEKFHISLEPEVNII